MKTNRFAITLVIVVLMGLGWMVTISGTVSKESDYNAYTKQTKEYENKKLYQKAIMTCEKALEVKETKEMRTKLLDLYKLSYEDETHAESDYIKAMEQACDLYPQEVGYWERLLDFLIVVEDYKEGNIYRKKAIREGVTSERLQELMTDIKYYYVGGYRTYDKFYRSQGGYYSVYINGKWGVVGPDGEHLIDAEYVYIGPWNQHKEAVYKNTRGSRLIDGDGVVQAIYDINAEEVKACDENCFPIKMENGWKYVDYDGKQILGVYEDVSSFQNDMAVVKKSDGWTLINKSGKGEVSFENVKLYGNGDYTYDDTMIAKSNGKYGIYDSNGKSVSEFSAIDMDIYLGEAIAFQDESGKWGFVNREGKILIEPQYESAKSFSSGLAAVCKDQKWGFVDEKGKLVIDYQFELADYFTKEGVCFVSEMAGQYKTIKLQFF